MRKLLFLGVGILVLTGCSGGNTLRCEKIESDTAQKIVSAKFNGEDLPTEISLTYKYHDLDETIIRSLTKSFDTMVSYVEPYDGYTFSYSSKEDSAEGTFTVDTTKFSISNTEGADPMVVTFGNKPEERTKEDIQSSFEREGYLCK